MKLAKQNTIQESNDRHIITLIESKQQFTAKHRLKRAAQMMS